tara:strand:+ start:353 stop:1210 length:858 start_codon:yes stop_codon:yes gene_type:complete
MAKKAKKEVVAETVTEKEIMEVIENFQEDSEDMYIPPIKETKKAAASWEIKERHYYLKNGLSPLSYRLKSKALYYFDEDRGFEREMKYAQNQQTPFVDEMQGVHRLGHIVFRNGILTVPRQQQTLQRLLSLYHPDLNSRYAERDDARAASTDLDYLEIEIEALVAAQSLDINMAEAVMRVEVGSRVADMSSHELKRDLLLYAKRNPSLFLELVNDENVMLRNFGIKAVEAGLLSLSPDNRNFLWASTKRKLFTVPFDEHPYSALAMWFKTDEGLEIYSNIEKRLK